MNPNRTHAFVNQFTLFSLIAICVGGSASLGAVWMRHQISVTAHSIKGQEARIEDLQRRIADTATAIEVEQSPDVLRRRNEQHHLGLVLPSEAMVKRVTADAELLLATKRNQGLFSADSGAIVLLKADTGTIR